MSSPSLATSTEVSKAVVRTKDNLAVGYLRAFVTLLVLAHHSVLAYITMAPPVPGSLLAQPRWWMAFPVVDRNRSPVWTLFVGFNDIFFMSLMFLLSGLFVWNSLERKGAGKFARDRAIRLGIPFLVAAAAISPLAYYPAYLQTGATGGVGGFLHEWMSLGQWPSGPAWFVSLLLVFDCTVALMFVKSSQWGELLGKLAHGTSDHPFRFFALLLSVSAATYIPLAVLFGAMRWTALGPFTFQTSRLVHYFVYFLAGICLGAFGLERGLLAQCGRLAQNWPRWTIEALAAFGFGVVALIFSATAHLSTQTAGALNGFAFVLSCAASCFACLAIFVRFAKTRHGIFESLRDNAYGMYLIHYAFVSWLQYMLLPAAMPGLLKGSIVFLGTVALSWGAISGLRRIPAVARVI